VSGEEVVDVLSIEFGEEKRKSKCLKLLDVVGRKTEVAKQIF
jgi:hypothetical protein